MLFVFLGVQAASVQDAQQLSPDRVAISTRLTYDSVLCVRHLFCMPFTFRRAADQRTIPVQRGKGITPNTEESQKAIVLAFQNVTKPQTHHHHPSLSSSQLQSSFSSCCSCCQLVDCVPGVPTRSLNENSWKRASMQP